MRIEQKNIPEYAEPVSCDDLRIGEVYYSLTYIDDDLLVPSTETVIYAGRNLASEDNDMHYFQDFESHRRGVRFQTATEQDRLSFFMCSSNEMSNVFRLEKAVEELMRCIVRHQQKGA